MLLSSTSPAFPAPNTAHVPVPAQQFPSAKRKRCFSDSEDQRPSKYLQSAPLSRIASNPLPMPNDLLHKPSEDLLRDYLLNQSFSYDNPPSTLSEVLDDSTPVDVDYYQYSLSPVILDDGLQPELTLYDCRCRSFLVFTGFISHMAVSAPTSALQESIGLSPSIELNLCAEGLQGMHSNLVKNFLLSLSFWKTITCKTS